MKRNLFFAFCITILPGTVLWAQGGAKPKTPVAKPAAAAAAIKLKSLKDSASYALGYNVGQSLGQNYKEMDLNILAQALKDGYGSKPAAVPVENARQLVTDYSTKVNQQVFDKNMKEGEAFLKKNATQPGVTTTSSGLQYIVLKKGDGPLPALTDKVRVHYFGVLLNGAEFDNSYKRNTPAEFQVTGVIPGWTEVLQLMPVGSKYKVFVPANLGYGNSAMGPVITPGSTLVFEVELLDIVK